MLVHRLYAAVDIECQVYRAKTTIHEYRDPLSANNPHSYEVTEIELIESSSTPSSKAEYDKYPPKLAPLERNKLIVDNSDCVLAFWDGTSRGTKFTIDYVRKKNKPIKIVQI